MTDDMKAQIQSAQKILDETHPAMFGTGKRIAELEADLAAVQAEAEALREWQVRKNSEVAAIIAQRDEALIAESKALVDLAAAQTRADAMLRVAEKWEAEAAALRVDAERYRWLREERQKVAGPCAYAPWNGPPLFGETLDAAIDAARGGGK